MPNRATNDFNDQTILDECWIGKKTNNIFKATEVKMKDGEKMVTIQKFDGKTYEITVDQFCNRFRQATKDELWKHLMERASVAQAVETETSDVGFFLEPNELDDLDRLVLFPETLEAIKIGLHKINFAAQMEEVWQLSKIDARGNRCVLSAYGEPGTGKTSAAKAIAKAVGKKLYQVDYAQMISKYPGDTAKHIKLAFKVARESETILFFDEADAMVSRRIDMSEDQQAYATSINQNRVTLMSELDRHNGIVIMSTNHFKNFDPAILRRIAQHIKFPLPNVDMLVEIYKRHLPNRSDATHVEIDDRGWETVANASRGFSGGDVLNVVLNGITRASLSPHLEEWKLTINDLLLEANKVREAKNEHNFRSGTT